MVFVQTGIFEKLNVVVKLTIVRNRKIVNKEGKFQVFVHDTFVLLD